MIGRGKLSGACWQASSYSRGMMPLSPLNDIVMEVAQAADPERLNIARQRLTAGASSVLSRSGGGDFDPEHGVPASPAVAPGIQGRLSSVASKSVGRSALTPAQRFEAEMLKTMIEAVLPKEGGAEFGRGPGAGIWRSMLAEGLAEQISKAGGIGLQRIIERQLSKPTASVEPATRTLSSGDRAQSVGPLIVDMKS